MIGFHRPSIGGFQTFWNRSSPCESTAVECENLPGWRYIARLWIHPIFFESILYLPFGGNLSKSRGFRLFPSAQGLWAAQFEKQMCHHGLQLCVGQSISIPTTRSDRHFKIGKIYLPPWEICYFLTKTIYFSDRPGRQHESRMDDHIVRLVSIQSTWIPTDQIQAAVCRRNPNASYHVIDRSCQSICSVVSSWIYHRQCSRFEWLFPLQWPSAPNFGAVYAIFEGHLQ